MPSQTSATSAGELFDLIRTAGGLTRQQLLAHTGMARSTLYGRLDQLTAAGYIRESGQLSSTGGRPATVVAFNDHDRSVLTIDIGHHRAAVALHHPNKDLIDQLVLPRTPATPINNFATALDQATDQLLTTHPHLELLGIGLALPAPVDIHRQQRLPSIALPDATYPLVEHLAERHRVPVAVENDARAFALGAAAEVPPMPEDSVLIGVKYSTGIGIGLLTGGHIMRGVNGAAGDLGHLQITPGTGPTCTCGRRGCLAAYASGRAIVTQLDRPDIANVTDLARHYDDQDPATVAAVHAAAALLGTHLGGFVQVSNPQYVTFGGFLGGRPPIADRISQAIEDHIADRISHATEFRVASADTTTAAGLVQLVLNTALSPDRVNEQCQP